MRWHRLVALAVLVLMVIDLASGVRLWRVAVSSGLFRPDPFDPAITAVIERSDPLYVAVVLTGVAVSVLTAVSLAMLSRRDARRQSHA